MFALSFQSQYNWLVESITGMKLFYFLILTLQLFYSLYGSEVFPFSRYDTFSRYKKINGQKIYRVLSDPDSSKYLKEGVDWHINTSITHYLYADKLSFTEIEERLPFSLYAVDEFTIDYFKDGDLIKKRRVYTK